MSEAIQKANGQGVGAYSDLRRQAADLVSSGFLPRSIRTPEQALAVMLTGRELGLGPMESFRSIHIIEGKPTLSAALMAGLALRRVPGGMLRIVETSSELCQVEASRPGYAKPLTVTWTISDARGAGIANKDNWRKYPRAMLQARALSEAARAVFPDAVAGLYDPDELGAVTSPDGEVVSLPAEAPAPDFAIKVRPELDGYPEQLFERLATATLSDCDAIESEIMATKGTGKLTKREVTELLEGLDARRGDLKRHKHEETSP